MNLRNIRIHYILRLVIFWMLYFAFFRVLFVIYHHANIPNGQHGETGLSFFYALRLDLATACAASFVPFVLWALQQFYKKRSIHRINKVYNFLVISIVASLSVANLKVYGESGELLNAADLNYLCHPQVVYPFISLWSILLLLAACSLFSYVGIRAYKKILVNFSAPIENKMLRLAQLILIPIVFLIAGRGGLRDYTLDESSANYSNLQINNDIATNNIYYLVHSMLGGSK